MSLTMSFPSFESIEQLTQSIETFYYRTRPDSEDIIEKDKLCKYIQECVKYLHNRCLHEIQINQQQQSIQKNQAKKKKKFKNIFFR